MKSMKCTVGFHNFFLDSALMNYAYRCALCGIWQDKKRGERVEQERKLINENQDLDNQKLKALIIDKFFTTKKKL